MADQGYCWCGKALVTGIKGADGVWFPFGFANCPTHSCFYDSKEEYKEHLARVKLRVKREKHPVMRSLTIGDKPNIKTIGG